MAGKGKRAADNQKARSGGSGDGGSGGSGGNDGGQEKRIVDGNWEISVTSPTRLGKLSWYQSIFPLKSLPYHGYWLL